jgi:hypothetical protein
MKKIVYVTDQKKWGAGYLGLYIKEQHNALSNIKEKNEKSKQTSSMCIFIGVTRTAANQCHLPIFLKVIL